MPEEKTTIKVCDKCSEEKEFDPGVIKTSGRCVICHRVKLCSDVRNFSQIGRTYHATDAAAMERVRLRDEDADGRYVCPHCEEEIDHLRFNASVDQYGTCQVDGSDWDTDDDSVNDTSYECPECNAQLGTTDDGENCPVQLSEWRRTHETEEDEAPEVKSTKA